MLSDCLYGFLLKGLVVFIAWEPDMPDPFGFAGFVFVLSAWHGDPKGAPLTFPKRAASDFHNAIHEHVSKANELAVIFGVPFCYFYIHD